MVVRTQGKITGSTEFYAPGGGVGKNWMAATVHKPGALRTAAHRAGMSTMEYARSHKDSPGPAGKRSRLALIFAKYRAK